MSDAKLQAVQKALENIKESLANVEAIVREIEGGNRDLTDADIDRLQFTSDEDDAEAGSIIEGVFDGYQMIGPDGKKYSVPPNYASKSKLVEGDLLKLTIAPDGAFIYKQIKPIERDRLRGKLVKDTETEEFRVLVDKKLYKVLLASVTYYRGKVGDEAIILVPTGGQSGWAAVDNIIASADMDDPFADL